MSKWFSKWTKKAKITNKNLLNVISNIDATNYIDLGGGLFKVRVARVNQGKSSGYRTLLVYKKSTLALFIYGFAKNEKDNISSKELEYFKKQAKFILNLDNLKINKAISNNEFIELEVNNEK